MSKKLSTLTVATTVATTDTVPFTSAPASAPVSKRITFANLITSLKEYIRGAIGGPYYLVDAGAADAISITLAVTPTDWSELVGITLAIKIVASNTGATTLAVTGLTGTKSVIKDYIGALASGDLSIGRIYEFIYDGTYLKVIPNNTITPSSTAKMSLRDPTHNAPLPIFANNAAALSGSLVEGDFYMTATGQVMIVYGD